MITYLYDDAAIDVSRITGIPWAYEQVESHSRPRPCINLLDLDWWDRMRVSFTVIACEYLLEDYMRSHGTSGLDSDLVAVVSAEPVVTDQPELIPGVLYAS